MSKLHATVWLANMKWSLPKISKRLDRQWSHYHLSTVYKKLNYKLAIVTALPK